MGKLSQLLNRPEYVHAAINHLPLIGLLLALLVLAVGLGARSRPVLLTGLALVALMALSVWPVYYFGEAGYDRVLSMTNETGDAFLKYHRALAGRWVFLYYVTAGLAALGLGVGWKRPRWLAPAAGLALVAGLASLAAGILIAQAGGEIRHREFRFGPPPKTPPEQADSP